MSDENETQGEPTTNVDALDASLNDLLKAANATDVIEEMRKASAGGKGTVEGGRGNDFADEGDAGKNDAAALMYGKMAEMGIQGVSFEQAQALAAFMHGKGGFPMVPHDRPGARGKAGEQFGGGDDEGDDEGDEGDDDEEPPAPVGKRRGRGAPPPFMQKSFAETFADDEDIAKAVDVAPFLEALTARTTDGLDSLAKAMRTSEKNQGKVNRALAIAVTQLGTLVKSQQHVIRELGSRLGVVESTPMPSRAATGTHSGARPLAKSMEGGGAPTGAGKLGKREIVSTLSYMNIEKGIREIGGAKTSDIIVKAEAGNILPKSVLDTVHTFLRTNPMEAEQAKSYT